MPFADNDGVSVHYEVGGDAATSEVPVVLLADACYGPWQWGWQFAALATPFEVVIPSTRGTGESDTADSYAVGEQAADLEAVLADHGARAAHLVGAGMGGMVALRYALEFSRARTLTLLGTSPGGPRAEPIPPDLRERLAVGDDPDAFRRSLGAVADEELLATDELVERIVSWRRAEDAGPDACRGHLEAMAEFDASDRLYEITVPALVAHGADDRVVPVGNGRLLADGLPNAEFREFPGEHLFYVTRSKAVNDAVVGFLTDHCDD